MCDLNPTELALAKIKRIECENNVTGDLSLQKKKRRRRNSSVTSSTTNLTSSQPRPRTEHSGLCSEKPASSCLSYGHCLIYINTFKFTF
jgi:hypothetical protein